MRTHDDEATSPLAVGDRADLDTPDPGSARSSRRLGRRRAPRTREASAPPVPPTEAFARPGDAPAPEAFPPTTATPSVPPRAPTPRVTSSVRSPGWTPTAGDGPAPAAPQRVGRQALVVRLLLVLLIAAVVASIVLVTAREAQVVSGGDNQADDEVPALQVNPAPIQLGTVGQPVGLAAPGGVTLPALPAIPLPGAGARPTTPGIAPATGSMAALAAWSAQLGAKTEIPPRALQAYGLAELVMRKLAPNCHFSWVTVAGLARIESNHGRFHGSSVGPDGEVTPTIVGVPLDGTNGNTTILDGGSYAAAMGPLQFIPSTWLRWGVDTHGTGRADINNIDDAAVTAGRYLCAAGGDLATGPGWRSAVLAYNASDDYARRVYTAADAYAHGQPA